MPEKEKIKPNIENPRDLIFEVFGEKNGDIIINKFFKKGNPLSFWNDFNASENKNIFEVIKMIKESGIKDVLFCAKNIEMENLNEDEVRYLIGKLQFISHALQLLNKKNNELKNIYFNKYCARIRNSKTLKDLEEIEEGIRNDFWNKIS